MLEAKQNRIGSQQERKSRKQRVAALPGILPGRPKAEADAIDSEGRQGGDARSLAKQETQRPGSQRLVWKNQGGRRSRERGGIEQHGEDEQQDHEDRGEREPEGDLASPARLSPPAADNIPQQPWNRRK